MSSHEKDPDDSSLTSDDPKELKNTAVEPEPPNDRRSSILSMVDFGSIMRTFTYSNPAPSTSKEDRRRSATIDRWLESEALRMSQQARTVLFGDVEQTALFWKQSRLLSTPLYEEEISSLRNEVRSVVLRGVKDGLLDLADGARESPEPESQALEIIKKLLRQETDDDSRDMQAQAIVATCQNQQVLDDLQKTVNLSDNHRTILGLQQQSKESCSCKKDQFTLGQLERVFAMDYQPDAHDWFHFDKRIAPLVRETSVQLGHHTISVIDLSIRSSQRRKWIHVMDDCACLIFVANLAHYCEPLIEDDTATQLGEMFALFQSIGNSKRFPQTPIMLVLTNVGGFKEKLSTCPLKEFFPEYDGDTEEQATQYLTQRFLDLLEREDRETVGVCVSDVTSPEGATRILEGVEKLLNNTQKTLPQHP